MTFFFFPWRCNIEPCEGPLAFQLPVPAGTAFTYDADNTFAFGQTTQRLRHRVGMENLPLDMAMLLQWSFAVTGQHPSYPSLWQTAKAVETIWK